MANTLTNHIPDFRVALDVISRELVGLTAAVSRDSGAEQAAVGETIRSFVAPASTAADITAAQTAPDSGNQVIGSKVMTISKSRAVPIRWNGEEQMGVNNGIGFNKIFADQLTQGMRTLVNEIEADLAGLHAKASNAILPAGTTLFDANNYKDGANALKGLNLNGAPLQDRQLVLSNVAAAAYRGNSNYSSSNTAGTDSMLRQGVLVNQFGFDIRESNQIVDTFTNGTGAGYLLNDASSAVGDTAIEVDTGSGTVIVGDIISFAGDDNYYVVEIALVGTELTIAAPGLKVAIADSAAITVADQTQRNMAFSRDAIHLVTRAPAMPQGGDMAADVMVMQDPRSGLAFELAVYREFRQVHYSLGIAWGYEMIKPEHCVLLVD